MLCYSVSVKNRQRKDYTSKRHFRAGRPRKDSHQAKPAVMRGILRVNSRAVGFVASGKKGDDIRIETENLAAALHKDEVEIELLRELARGQRTGRVVRIIRRHKTRFVGTIEEGLGNGESGFGFVLLPDDFRMYAPIVIPRPPREARQGYKALVQLREWKPGHRPVGEILKIIGKKGEHEAEMQSILLEKGFTSGFPREVEQEAADIARKAVSSAVPREEIARRRDFRNAALFTIDPKNAKDFDDAISFREIQNTKHQIPRYEIGVHIADVSHYVRAGTALDREARERGTSVYLVDRTIPMLPYILSNDLCSLNPNVDRLAFSAVFELDGDGKVYSRWFGKSIIRSKMRFTYESAQGMIDAVSTRSDLVRLNSIAKKLHAEKMKKGAIDFEHEEVGFELDKNGHPLRVFKKERLDAHKLVEEFMLLANREVAEFLWKEGIKAGIPPLYRIHDIPDSEKISELRVFARALGHDLPFRKGGRIHGKDLQALFQKIEGKAEESLIKTAAIRSMAKAVYSTRNIGHFGLAFEYYTHFTSPIRRYPDLIVHRLLYKVLKRRAVDSQEITELERIAEDATEKEIAAADAERESIKLKQVEFMEGFIGKEFSGTISGVTEWGVYIEENETKAEGMVKLRSLADDYYVLDEKNYRIVGQRTKKKYALGDKVRFRVAGADRWRKTLDYVIP